MPSARDVTVDSEFIKVFMVGVPGSGKSVFASTFPTPGFVYDFSNGILIYRGLDFDYEQYPTSAAGWTKFERDSIRIEKEVREGKYVSVIVDDLTAMEAVCMERALQLDPKRSATNGPIWNVHYQMVRNLMEGKLRRLVDLPCNIVFIAHLDIITDDDGNILAIEPLLVGKLSKIMPGYFDEVYYSSTRKGANGIEWLVQTVPIGYKQARSRLSGKQRLLPDFFPNDFAELMKHIVKARQTKVIQPQTQNIGGATT